MHKPRERERGWRYLGEEVCRSGKNGVGDVVPVLELTFGVDNDLILTYTNSVHETTMTKQELNTLVAAAQGGDQKAKTALLLKYENLCHKMARKFAFTATNHDHDDLFQEGQMGLLLSLIHI